MTWPLARDAKGHVLGAIYHWDAYTNAMIMGGHVDAVLGRAPLSLYDNYFFAPLSDSIVFNENLFGLSLLFAPFYLITGSPLWAYNLTLLLSLSLSVLFTFLLVRRLVGSDLAGLLAGVAFAFCPYVMFELGRIQLVATQWIPACFLMLHRAVDEKRLRDVVGLWACALMQIGTGLYYAMFLVPILGFAAVVLLVRQRPPRRFLAQLAAGGAVAGAIALLMVRPYFSARERFDLERSLDFASSYDGKLGFLANVHETNLTLTGLHHLSESRGAHEEVAFPGFTVLALVGVVLGVAAWKALRRLGARSAGIVVARWSAFAGLALVASLLLHTLLAGLAVLGAAIAWEKRRAAPVPFAGPRGLYFALLLLALVMFLGLVPAHFGGEPVHGLYYYFHNYFPGFNGIRKVSRQAVLVTFCFVVLASFGSAWLFSRLSRPRSKAVLFTVLLAGTAYELRCFPHPTIDVWAGARLPKAYHFLAQLPPEHLVAAIPQNGGQRVFRGDRGLAYHNYLMLHHKHRSLNGQSTWQPPVTRLVQHALERLPDDGARRILQTLGARHILVHAGDLPKARRALPEQLARQPEHFREVFRDGSDWVFSLDIPDDPTLALMDTPALPDRASEIPARRLKASASLNRGRAARAIDGDPRTAWGTGRSQAPGQYFELELDQPHQVVALEIENHYNQIDLPLSFDLEAADAGSSLQTVAALPVLRLYEDLVFSPKTFVFRVVLSEPVQADRIRLRLVQPVPGRPLTIHELRVFGSGE